MSQLNATQAHAIYRKVVAHYEGQFAADSGPELVHDWEKTWDSPAPIIPWAVVWQYGPDNWAVSVSHNDVIPRDMGFVEPATGHVLALYPA